MVWRPDKTILSGDRDAAKMLIGKAHSEMRLLEHQMDFLGLQQGVRTVRPLPRILIKCSKVFGQRNCLIHVDSGYGKEKRAIEQSVVKIFVHVDMFNQELWQAVVDDGVFTGDRVTRDKIVSAVACGVVNVNSGKVVWLSVKEPYSATYDCNLLAEHSGTDWEGVYSIVDTAENANLVINYYNTLFSDSYLHEDTLPVVENKWIKTKAQAGALVYGVENYAISAVLTSGYSSVYTTDDDSNPLVNWTNYTYSNNSSSVWLTPPNFISYGYTDRYDVYPWFYITSTTSAIKMPFIRYQELLSDGVTYDERKYTQGVQLLIRHDWHGGSPYAATMVEVNDLDHRYYRMRLCPIVGYVWCLPDEQQEYRKFEVIDPDLSQLYQTELSDILVRGLHRTIATYSTETNKWPYRGSQMTPQTNHLMFENGNCYEQNYELQGGFSWYCASAGGNITDRFIDTSYVVSPSNDITTTHTYTETVRGLYNICALAGYNLPKWGSRHMNPINGAIKEIAAAAIEYLGGTVYDNATIPLNIPTNDAAIINGDLEFPTIDFKQVPGLLYCSPLFNIRVNCIPVKKKIRIEV